MRFRGWDRIDSRRAVLGSTAGRWDLAAAKPPPAVAAETGPRGKRGSSSRPALARSPDLVVIPTMPTRLFLGSAFLNRKSFFSSRHLVAAFLEILVINSMYEKYCCI